MLPFDTILSFITSSALLGLAPGPDNIFVLTESAMNGRKGGILVTLGLCTGLIFHTLAVSLGVAAIFQVSPLAFNSLKIVGGCYLLFLAWQAFKAKNSDIEENSASESKAGKSLFRKGVIMNITNPKVAIFFMAFLPQFTDPKAGNVTFQMILLGLIFIITTIFVFGSIAILADFLRYFLIKSPKSQLVINKIAGLVFVALAIKLFFTQK